MGPQNSKNNQNQLQEKPIGQFAIDKLKSIKNNITNFIQKKKVNNRSEYSSLPTVNWDDEEVIYDRSNKNDKKEFYDDYL